MRAILTILLCTATTAVSQNADALLQKAQKAFKPVPSSAPVLKSNPANPSKVELGKMLWFDPRLSASWLISCNTCHNLSLGGVDLLETSIGHGWQKGPRNSPTVFNAVFNLAQFWDGRAKDLKEQAMGPVQAAVEMNSTPDRTVKTLRSIPAYVGHFKQAFPGEADPVTFENMARAIVFEATLITPQSRFDQYLGGRQDAITAAEKRTQPIPLERLRKLPQRRESRWYRVFSVRRSGETGRRHPTANPQGPVPGHQYGQRRVCLQITIPA